jgi:hypothetical protein
MVIPYTLYPGPWPKKYTVYVPDRNNHLHTIHFGDQRYEDFTMHHDERRLNNYLIRHQHDQFYNPYKPSFWSTYVLWNPFKIADIHESFLYAASLAQLLNERGQFL